MKMTIKEFEEKVEKIDELEIDHNPVFNTYKWSVTTTNDDIRTHLEGKLMNELNLTDGYNVPNRYGNKSQMWIKREKIDDIINCINNANSYQEILDCLKNKPFIGDDIKITRYNDMDQDIDLSFKDLGKNNERNYIYRILIDKCEDIENISWSSYHYDSRWTLKTKKIKEKEMCRHKCKTDYRIGKIDEILGI